MFESLEQAINLKNTRIEDIYERRVRLWSIVRYLDKQLGETDLQIVKASKMVVTEASPQMEELQGILLYLEGQKKETEFHLRSTMSLVEVLTEQRDALQERLK